MHLLHIKSFWIILLLASVLILKEGANCDDEGENKEEDTTAVAGSAAGGQTPAEDESSKIDESPSVDESSKVDESPSVDESSKVNDPLVTTQSTKTDESPSVDESLKADESPSVDESSKVDESPITDSPKVDEPLVTTVSTKVDESQGSDDSSAVEGPVGNMPPAEDKVPKESTISADSVTVKNLPVTEESLPADGAQEMANGKQSHSEEPKGEQQSTAAVPIPTEQPENKQPNAEQKEEVGLHPELVGSTPAEVVTAQNDLENEESESSEEKSVSTARKDSATATVVGIGADEESSESSEERDGQTTNSNIDGGLEAVHSAGNLEANETATKEKSDHEVDEPPSTSKPVPVLGEAVTDEVQAATTEGLQEAQANTDTDELGAIEELIIATTVSSNYDETLELVTTDSVVLQHLATTEDGITMSDAVVVVEVDDAAGTTEMVSDTVTSEVNIAMETTDKIMETTTLESTTENFIGDQNLPEEGADMINDTVTAGPGLIETVDDMSTEGSVTQLIVINENVTTNSSLVDTMSDSSTEGSVTQLLSINETVTAGFGLVDSVGDNATEDGNIIAVTTQETTTTDNFTDSEMSQEVTTTSANVTTVEDEVTNSTEVAVLELGLILTTLESELADTTTEIYLTSSEVTTIEETTESSVLENSTEPLSAIEEIVPIVIESQSENVTEAPTHLSSAAEPKTTRQDETTTATTTVLTTSMQQNNKSTVRPLTPSKVNKEKSFVTMQLSRTLTDEEKRNLRRALARYLNKRSRGNRRTKRSGISVIRRSRRDLKEDNSSEESENEFTEDDILLESDGEVLSLAIQSGDGYLSAEEIETIMKDFESEAEQEIGADILSIRARKVLASQAPEKSIWDIHYGLFITVIVLFSVFLLVVLIYIVRFSSKGTHANDKTPMTIEEGKRKSKHPVIMSSPFTDEEMIKEDVPIAAKSTQPNLYSAPPGSEGPPTNGNSLPRGTMKERDNAAVTRNGGGQHLARMEEEYEFGVVPLDHLSRSEMNLPDVENTKF